MKNMKKIVMGLVCALALVTASVMGTMAYLTSTDEVVNTFTVGNVQIKLDEAKTYQDGSLVPNGGRVQANKYKLLPGHTYNKDPRVTVLANSEESYVKMTVTIDKLIELDKIFANDGADLINIFTGYDESKWQYQGNTKDVSNNTRTYEFWYYKTVNTLATTDKSASDLALEPLFTKVVVPGSITNTQLATIQGMTITVNAYAIQADGFKTAADAWATYEN